MRDHIENNNVESLLWACRKRMARMSNEGRLAFIRALLEGYCPDCGRVVKPIEGRCHCANDE